MLLPNIQLRCFTVLLSVEAQCVNVNNIIGHTVTVTVNYMSLRAYNAIHVPRYPPPGDRVGLEATRAGPRAGVNGNDEPQGAISHWEPSRI